ncbi:HK97-gp10 family putative phage morphogenesis protein [Streptomyces sp. STCH 565 A]|uniref:HK97-gp10 family putative phage morphogenesis protein n=1 Tax=Streptomyces sp. STCH 565 A TaxID=2950532 RepID=UPI0020765866|nr:HK97-gp10 family putative phage morphogenesis protein [Streptomyces sp. STCH 565 A]MCM8550069.1 HK97 gp10 family phage protein [Streptomyces sp. STCH 565 A]
MAHGRAHVTITGLARLRGRLEDLPDEIRQALARAVKESAEAVRDDVKRTVAVDSGNLQEKADIRYQEDGLVAQVGWHDQEDFYAVFVERGTRRQDAQPSLMPALERERGRYRGRLTAEVRRVLR